MAQGRSSAWKSTEWAKYYRPRLRAGEYMCRMMPCTNTAERFAHIVPHSKGGRSTMANLTLLCSACDQKIGDTDVTFMGLETIEQSWRDLNKLRSSGYKTKHVSNKDHRRKRKSITRKRMP